MPHKTKAKKLVKRLNRRHAETGSWRAVAKEYPPIIKAGTLSTIAKGDYIPVDTAILVALGLKSAPKLKRISDMSSAELLWRLVNRKEMEC